MTRGSREIWVDHGDDDILCSLSGECMTREAFDRLHPPGSHDVFVISPVDAEL